MAHGHSAMGRDVLSGAMSGMTTPRVPAFEIGNVRSYMFEMETKEALHIARLGADDIARALEKLAIGGAWVCTDGDVLIIKLGKTYKLEKKFKEIVEDVEP